MGRVLGKSPNDYIMLDLSSRQLDAVAKSKHAFLEINPEPGRNTENVEVAPDDQKKHMNVEHVNIKVMPCRCKSKCALKRLQEKHGNNVDCTIYYV
ncbi:hypothetical protein O3G_MSEX003481 [Manduca sexta]|uniref:Uncharacterized protein n=1 Tax=Manduca sexta TaxID=7130 RepID=A0A921YRS0_MANSE|nr:hypothetical protein O3G_MSEX003481 [Manduca sexta]